MYRFILIVILMVSFTGKTSAARKDAKDTILVIGLDTSQFFSNVFFKKEVAYYNNIPTDSVIPYFNWFILMNLREYSNRNFVFMIADSADQVMVKNQSIYTEVENKQGEVFFGIAAAENTEVSLVEIMEKYNADYLLTLNAYEIYRQNPPSFVTYSTKTEHLIHFDLFDQKMNSFLPGKSRQTSYAIEAFLNQEFYREFAADIINRIEAYEKEKPGLSLYQKYEMVNQTRFTNHFGIGLQVGVGSPYGLLGTELSYYLTDFAELNAGLGFDFSGFKVGAGARIYFLQFDQQFKPFFSLHFSRASGNTFRVGTQPEDQLIQQDNRPQFKILADNNLHVKGGIRFIRGNQTILASAGYGFSFNAYDAEYVNGNPPTDSERNFADFMAVGGLDITLTYLIFLGF